MGGGLGACGTWLCFGLCQIIMERFAARREGPPCEGFTGTGLVDGGHEGVEDARVLALAGLFLQAAVEGVGFLGGELVESFDAEEIEVAEHGGADIS